MGYGTTYGLHTVAFEVHLPDLGTQCLPKLVLVSKLVSKLVLVGPQRA